MLLFLGGFEEWDRVSIPWNLSMGGLSPIYGRGRIDVACLRTIRSAMAPYMRQHEEELGHNYILPSGAAVLRCRLEELVRKIGEGWKYEQDCPSDSVCFFIRTRNRKGADAVRVQFSDDEDRAWAREGLLSMRKKKMNSRDTVKE